MPISLRRHRFGLSILGPGRRGGRAHPVRSFRPDDPGRSGLERRVVPSRMSVSSGIAMAARGGEQANVVYPTPGGPVERLNVYTPSGPTPSGGRPVVIAIHGGGWYRFSKTGYGDRIASAFVPAGYVVVAPNYPLATSRNPTWPINLDDLRSVVAWVRSHATELGVDPNRVAAMGESAGGNLAELLGTEPGPSGTGSSSTKVNAVIAFSAPSNLSALYAVSPWAGRAAARFLGGPPGRIPQKYADASPIDHVAPGDPPMLLVHGVDDTLVPVGQSQAMASALATAGVPHRLILVPGGHDLDFPGQYADLTQSLLEFLSTTWKDEETLSRSH